MQLQLSTDIALRTLIYLGQKNDTATIQEIATAFDISKTHLMKVVMTLVAEKLLVSERGRNGGIRLAKAPDKISVAVVVKLMENNLALVECLKASATPDCCPLLPRCRLKKIFQKAQTAFLDTLSQHTLADLLN